MQETRGGRAAEMLQLSVESDNPAGDLEDLADWLAQESRLRGMIKDGESAPGSGQLGGVTDFLIAAVSSGGAISVLITSLQAYFSTRNSDLTIKLKGPRGTITVDARRVRDTEALVRAAREAVGVQ
jgi:hypothetical protein